MSTFERLSKRELERRLVLCTWPSWMGADCLFPMMEPASLLSPRHTATRRWRGSAALDLSWPGPPVSVPWPFQVLDESHLWLLCVVITSSRFLLLLKLSWNAVVKKTTIRTSPVFYTLVSSTVCSHESAVYVIGPFTILRGLAYHSNCDAHLLQYQQNAGEAENNRHISKGNSNAFPLKVQCSAHFKRWHHWTNMPFPRALLACCESIKLSPRLRKTLSLFKEEIVVLLSVMLSIGMRCPGACTSRD